MALAAVLSYAFLPSSFASEAPPSHTADQKTLNTFARMADDVLSQRTEALVEDRSGRRPAASGAKTRMSPQLQKDEAAALSSLQSRKTRLKALGEAYSDADTKVTVDKSTITKGHATVQVTEDTTLTYKKVRGDEPTTTGFKTRYELNLTAKPGGAWELSSIASKENGPVAVNEPTAVKKVAAIDDDGQTYPDGTPASTSYPAPAKPKVKTGGTYDYAAMAAYAEKYWKNYNPAYRQFNGAGGDCTNFISQSLKAGGWQNVSGTTYDYRNWWYDGSLNTDSWAGANEWAWFTNSNKRATNLANVYQMDVGDILQMDFNRDGSKDHSMIVTYRSSAGTPYVTYHSTNTYRKSLASLIASYPNAVYFAYRT
ncbi:amidase domain-containing protein [Streptomyces sp. G-G2]|uniref:amidase domain-containing protein n=1 Tax=Streptomyces sp. G-G2 TaxID=3046201 RepID=UPI0024B8ABC9|nr:amidase domain-containing protein [Streptomyces sp. G-G2]MDJ0382038.1 amidase domain-containing protein [Streptomyces sp. G-G2]